MIPQDIYLCNYRYQGVTNSYVHISDFEDYTEQKRTWILIPNFKSFW
jgi:hypothetical protein